MKIMMNDNDNDNNEEKDEDDAEDYEENGCDNVCLRGMRRILYLPAQPCPHSALAMPVPLALHVGMYPHIQDAIARGEVLLEWDYSKGAPPKPLVKVNSFMCSLMCSLACIHVFIYPSHV